MIRILIGVNPKSHLLLAHDELKGLQEIGFDCKAVRFGRKDFLMSNTLSRLWDVMFNSLCIVRSLYHFAPDILYLNSRLEPVASIRDFITVLLIKCSYFKKLKIVIKSHGSNPEVLKKKSFFYRKILLPYLTKHVDAWFFLSREEKFIVRQYHQAMSEKIFITANIINPSRFTSSADFRKKYGLDNQKQKILFIGRIIDEKGIFEILKAIPLTNNRERCDFIFVGDGPDLGRLKVLTKQLQVSSSVKFTGWIDEQEADSFYADADLLVFPTYFNEGFPMALFKSVAAGLPVVTTKTRAAIDYLQMPDNVLWVDSKSEYQVAAAINELLSNDTLRNAMRLNNERLGNQFSQSAICSEMGKVFTSLCN